MARAGTINLEKQGVLEGDLSIMEPLRAGACFAPGRAETFGESGRVRARSDRGLPSAALSGHCGFSRGGCLLAPGLEKALLDLRDECVVGIDDVRDVVFQGVSQK